jgi:Immune Mapped Protein 2 (IMP2) N-terminal domain
MSEKKDPPTSQGPEGCYLLYESDSGGKLTLQYSQGEVPPSSVGFWTPGEDKKIQGFKFKQNSGRSELIKGIAGGDANRRKYFVGWCQFIKLARQMNGKVIKFPNADQGVEVDVYGFSATDNCPTFLDLDEGLVDVVAFDAIAVVPKHNVNFQGLHSLDMNNFLERGNIAGATTMLR